MKKGVEQLLLNESVQTETLNNSSFNQGGDQEFYQLAFFMFKQKLYSLRPSTHCLIVFEYRKWLLGHLKITKNFGKATNISHTWI